MVLLLLRAWPGIRRSGFARGSHKPLQFPVSPLPFWLWLPGSVSFLKSMFVIPHNTHGADLPGVRVSMGLWECTPSPKQLPWGTAAPQHGLVLVLPMGDRHSSWVTFHVMAGEGEWEVLEISRSPLATMIWCQSRLEPLHFGATALCASSCVLLEARGSHGR